MATILITGTSAGIGLATTLELARAGHRVWATMRNTAAATELLQTAARESLSIHVHELDVDSDDSVQRCFASLDEPVDVLVNNAGIEVHGSGEELPIEAFAATMNTNYLGAVRCMKAVIPSMRQRQQGCIINITSVAGRIANTPLGAYCASKFALEAISEAVAGELKPFGVRVAIVEPGIQNTRMARAIENPPASIYRQPVRFAAMFRAALENPVPPETTALVIREIIESGTWQLRHPSGPDAAPFLAWRASLSDEQFIDWNAREDEAWYEGLRTDFGMNVKPA